MKGSKLITVLILTALILTGFEKPFHQRNKWNSLFNGKNLDGWDTYIGPPLNDAGKKMSEIPVGLNIDPHHVFTVVKEQGEKVIRISGESWGGISTKNEYSDFHLQLKFKWGLLSWGQKKGKKKDSGLLYFAVGEHGADYGAWMRSQEFQVEEGNCGDYWGVAGGMEDIPVIKKSDSQYVYNPLGQMETFSATSKTGRHCIKRGDAENPTGEWNTLDLYCSGDTSVHMINGKVMMVLYHSKQMDNGQAKQLSKGKLQIQSEGAEIFYKDIKIRSLDFIPPEMLR
jgi:3-keto-disaccharide hydrolase